MWIMINEKQHIMRRYDTIFLLVTIISVTSAIRVDWNTNKGPILPPTTTEAPVPKPPYRDPAPVWENQDGDTVDPDPYRYVLPPPSRPKLENDNYARAPVPPKGNGQYNKPIYGKLISKNYDNNYNSIKRVPILAVEYIPNSGFKYNAVVPADRKIHATKNNFYYDKYSKMNGKYNQKSKKFKVYDKVKYVQPIFYFAPAQEQSLPYHQTPQPFISQQYTTIPTTQTTTYQNGAQYTKWSQKLSPYQTNAISQTTKSQR